jgi:amino acid adenylation domain-containing protein
MKNVEDIYPLTPTQAGILFHTLQAPNSGVYFQHYTCELVGSINLGFFRRAWEDVISRHPVLRTAFLWEGLDEPLQVVLQKVELPVEVKDWRNSHSDQKQEHLQRFLQQDRQQGYNLAKAPLMRLHLFQTAPDHYQFVWSFHHLLTDGWSVAIVLKEVFATYEALYRGQSPMLSQPRPFRDFIAWLQAQDSSKAETFWRRMLQDFNTPTSLRVNKRPDKQSQYENSYHEYIGTLSDQTTEALQNLAQAHRMTLNTILQGAWTILLSRYSGDSDVLFGATVSGRPSELSGVEDMVGMFINTLPVRVQINPETKLITWLKTLQTQLLELLQYEYSSLVNIQKWSEVPQGQALFDSIVVFENYPIDSTVFQDQHHVMEVQNIRYLEQSNYPLSLIVIPHKQLILRVIFDRNYYDDEIIVRLTGHLQHLLESIAVNPDQSIARIPMLSNIEQHRLLVEWNRTQIDYPQNRLIHQLFEEHVTATPNKIAVEETEDQLTYGKLDHRANQLAHYLQKLGVKANTPVGLVLERSIDMIVAILGVLKAGGAYLPLDPTYPQERLAFMLADTQAPIVLTHKKLAGSIPQHNGKTVFIDTEWDVIANEDSTSPNIGTIPKNLAYIIYTSGSTGVPKGVPVSHHNLVHSTAARFRFYEENVDRFLLLSSFTFDSSMVGIFWTLCQGGTLVLPPHRIEQDTEQLAATIAAHQISHILMLPSLYTILLEQADTAQLVSLQTVIVAGEECRRGLVDRHYTRLPQATLFNEYGPTEGTVWSTACEIPANFEGDRVPIGRPIPNMQNYILDSHNHPAPIGVPGELCIGGVGVTSGYLNRPELTAEKFVEHSFAGEPPVRLYRTGDLARYLPDGNIEFLGRIDHQIKIRGYRIEVGEIEAVLAGHPLVRQAVVVAHGSDDVAVTTSKRLVAYVEPVDSQKVSASELRRFLLDGLPDYMVPSAFVTLDALPLTSNRKVDRSKLPVPDTDLLLAADTAFVAPRTPVEESLAEIWASVLGVKRLGIHDNFFELGGDSILSIQLIAKAAQQNIKLKPNDIFRAPTVEQMSQVLQQGGRDGASSSLVTIQAEGLKPPLYFVPGNFGNVFTNLGYIARYLGSDQPFYGLQDTTDMPSQIPAMAERYVAQIRAFQPAGPYLLGGVCSGGLVAYEMAQQLLRQGHHVDLLALVETFAKEPNMRNLQTSMTEILHKLFRFLGFFSNHDGEGERPITRALGRRELGAYLRLKGKVVANILGATSYSPKPYPGRVDVFLTEESLAKYEPRVSWSRFAIGGAEMHKLPGTHARITGSNAEISKASMKVLAQQLEARIDIVLANPQPLVQLDETITTPE